MKVRQEDKDQAVDLAHALGISCEDFTSGAADILVQHLANAREAAFLAGARAMQWASVRACKQQQQDFLSEQYAVGQPMSSFQERFACSECERAINALAPQALLDGEGE